MQALRDSLAASAAAAARRSLDDLLLESSALPNKRVVELSDSEDLSSISDIDSDNGDDAKQPFLAKKQRKGQSVDDERGEDVPSAKRVRQRDAETASSVGHCNRETKTPPIVIVLDDTASSEDASSSSAIEHDSESESGSESEKESESDSSSGSSDDSNTHRDDDGHPSSRSDLPTTFPTLEQQQRSDPLPPPPVIADDLEFDDALDALGSEPKSHRLWPSLAGFNRLVTRWQPDRTAGACKPLREPPIIGNFPPSAGTSQVPLRFASHEDHRKIFAPLLLKECLAGLQTSEERDRIVKEKQRCGWRRGSLVSAMLWKDPKKDAVPVNAGALHVLSVEIEDRDENDDREYAELLHGDLVLLTCPAWAPGVTALAVVQGWDPDLDLLHLNTDTVSNERVHLCVCVHANRAREAAQGGWLIWSQIEAASIRNTPLWICGVGSVLTAAREFQALSSLPYIHPTLRDNVLRGQRAQVTRSDSRKYAQPPRNVSPQLWRMLRSAYNVSQVRAIWEVANCNAYDISLLQGPPGTGKTRTILGILSVLLAGAIPEAEHSRTNSQSGQASVRITVGASLQATSSRSGKGGSQRADDFIDISTTRVLVCAPSNTAVDEIVYRLRTQGVIGQNGKKWFPEVVRIGVPGGRYRQSQSSREAQKGPVRQTNSRSLPEVVQRAHLDAIVEEKRKISREHVSQIRKDVLRSAHVVCATLSGCGSQSLLEVLLQATAGSTNRSVQGYSGRVDDSFTGFDAVIIDEAAQAVEPSALIPFKFNPRTIVLVGDPAQLPATIRSAEVERAGYGQSLFERLQRAGHPMQMLELQYRMHPDICEFASRRFYSGRLENAKEVMGSARWKRFHRKPAFRPFVFHNVAYGTQQRGSHRDGSTSYQNLEEIRYALALYQHIREQFPEENLTFGIIAPYSQQIKSMRDQFRSRFPGVLQGSDAANRVEISTVDGFQGREMDIIIFTCVRAPDASGGAQSGAGTRGIGFLSEWRRLNVAITRAKYGLWMIGHAETLRQDSHWRELIEDARARNVLLTVNSRDERPWDAPPTEHQGPPPLLPSPSSCADEEHRSPRRDGRDRPSDSRGGERRGRDSSRKRTPSEHPSRRNEARGRHRDDSGDSRPTPREQRNRRDDSRDRRGGSRFSRSDSRDRGQVRYVKREDFRDYNESGNGNGSKRRRGDSRDGRRSRF